VGEEKQAGASIGVKMEEEGYVASSINGEDVRKKDSW